MYLCIDIDEDIFKALASDESLEEDRLAWLIFNENKKASKRRSSNKLFLIQFEAFFLMQLNFLGEFELPKCFKADTDVDNSEVLTSNIKEDESMKNKSPSKTHFSKSIFITDEESNEMYNDNFNEEDYLSWVSHSKGEHIFIFNIYFQYCFSSCYTIECTVFSSLDFYILC